MVLLASVNLAHGFGLGGIGLAVFLNGLGVPGLSEVLLPLGGVAVSRGRLGLGPLLAVALVAQMLGLAAAYLLASSGGQVLLERYGRYVLVSGREIRAARRAFERYGQWLVLFGAFIPGVQGFVGYLAGL